MSILQIRNKGSAATAHDEILNIEQGVLNVEWLQPLHFNIQYSAFNIQHLDAADVDPRPPSVTLTHFTAGHRCHVPPETWRDIRCPSATLTATRNNDLGRRAAPTRNSHPRTIRSYVNRNVRWEQMSLEMSLREIGEL
jgi:hypothetical protein